MRICKCGIREKKLRTRNEKWRKKGAVKSLFLTAPAYYELIYPFICYRQGICRAQQLLKELREWEQQGRDAVRVRWQPFVPNFHSMLCVCRPVRNRGNSSSKPALPQRWRKSSYRSRIFLPVWSRCSPCDTSQLPCISNLSHQEASWYGHRAHH